MGSLKKLEKATWGNFNNFGNLIKHCLNLSKLGKTSLRNLRQFGKLEQFWKTFKSGGTWEACLSKLVCKLEKS